MKDDVREWPIGRNPKLDELMVLFALSAARESGNGYDLNVLKSEAKRAADLWTEHQARTPDPQVAKLVEALEAITQRVPERDIKWIGMNPYDIAVFALAEHHQHTNGDTA